jgi:hypothetical protein
MYLYSSQIKGDSQKKKKKKKIQPHDDWDQILMVDMHDLYMPNLTDIMHIQQLRKVVRPPIQNIAGIRKQPTTKLLLGW